VTHPFRRTAGFVAANRQIAPNRNLSPRCVSLSDGVKCSHTARSRVRKTPCRLFGIVFDSGGEEVGAAGSGSTIERIDLWGGRRPNSAVSKSGLLSS